MTVEQRATMARALGIGIRELRKGRHPGDLRLAERVTDHLVAGGSVVLVSARGHEVGIPEQRLVTIREALLSGAGGDGQPFAQSLYRKVRRWAKGGLLDRVEKCGDQWLVDPDELHDLLTRKQAG